MAVELTEAASKQVKELKQAQNLPENAFLRMGGRGGGCSGMSYSLEFDTEKGPHDREFDIDGVKAVVDTKSYPYPAGITLDDDQPGLTGGVPFVKPTGN